MFDAESAPATTSVASTAGATKQRTASAERWSNSTPMRFRRSFRSQNARAVSFCFSSNPRNRNSELRSTIMGLPGAHTDRLKGTRPASDHSRVSSIAAAAKGAGSTRPGIRTIRADAGSDCSMASLKPVGPNIMQSSRAKMTSPDELQIPAFIRTPALSSGAHPMTRSADRCPGPQLKLDDLQPIRYRPAG